MAVSNTDVDNLFTAVLAALDLAIDDVLTDGLQRQRAHWYNTIVVRSLRQRITEAGVKGTIANRQQLISAIKARFDTAIR